MSELMLGAGAGSTKISYNSRGVLNDLCVKLLLFWCLQDGFPNNRQKYDAGVVSEGERGRGATEEGDVSSSCIPQFRWSCNVLILHPPMHTLLRCTPYPPSWKASQVALLPNNAAAHWPLRLVTGLYCRKLADNAWLHVTDKTTHCFLSHFPTNLAFSQVLQFQWFCDTWAAQKITLDRVKLCGLLPFSLWYCHSNKKFLHKEGKVQRAIAKQKSSEIRVQMGRAACQTKNSKFHQNKNYPAMKVRQ